MLIGGCTFSAVSAQRTTYHPLIGVSTEHTTPRKAGAYTTYSNAIIKAGGIPVFIPITDNMAELKLVISRLDGLLMTGGGDVNPLYYNEKPGDKLVEVDSIRDRYDIALIRLACNKHVPILGICRGCQLINVALGGTLYQDLPSEHPSDVIHSQKEANYVPTHDIQLVKGSLLYQLIKEDSFKVNSFHHQAVKQTAPGFIVTAFAPDSVVEAIESKAKNVIAVQFHPECLILNDHNKMMSLFDNFIARAKRYRAKLMHR